MRIIPEFVLRYMEQGKQDIFQNDSFTNDKTEKTGALGQLATGFVLDCI